jgi:hypothetical protein
MKDLAFPSFLVSLGSRQSPFRSVKSRPNQAATGLLFFTLISASERFRLSLDDFIFSDKVSTKKISQGIYRNFRQWTLSGRWKENSRVELNLHFLQFPGEHAVYFEPEVVNKTPEHLHLSELGFGLKMPFAKTTQVTLLGGDPIYTFKREGTEYILPSAARVWTGSLEELAARPPENNCGQILISDRSETFALWPASLHNSGCCGRTQYASLPLKISLRGRKAGLSFPFVHPFTGTNGAFLHPLPARGAHRAFAFVLTAGPTPREDPWKIIRDARTTAMKRNHIRSRALPPVAWGTWCWEALTEENIRNYTAEERAAIARHPSPPQHPDGFIKAAGCTEKVIKTNLPLAVATGFEMVWLDLFPFHSGSFAPAKARFPSGLKRLRKDLEKKGLSMSAILSPDNLTELWEGIIDWSDKLEKRFGRYRHQPAKEYLCLASPWAEYAIGKIAAICRDYHLGAVQVAFNHNQLTNDDGGCTASGHGHLPIAQSSVDYARGHLQAFNRLYETIYRQSPGTLIIENLPTVYDLGNPMPDTIWINDMHHLPPLTWLMLDYVIAQRRLFPMEIRFQNYLSMNLEPRARSVYLIANIALGNAITIGGDLRYFVPGLLDFCRDWIGFYRAHRHWLCGNLIILDRFTLAHRLPGEFLVFAFNSEDKSREVNVRFNLEQAGLMAKNFAVAEEHGASRSPLGKVAASHDEITWKQTIPARDFAVLRFRPSNRLRKSGSSLRGKK